MIKKVLLNYTQADDENKTKFISILEKYIDKKNIYLWNHHETTEMSTEDSERFAQLLKKVQWVVFLLSPDFVAEAAIQAKATQHLLQLAKQQGCHFTFVLLAPCDWRALSFLSATILPAGQIPLSKQNYLPLAWKVIDKKLGEQLTPSSAPVPSNPVDTQLFLAQHAGQFIGRNTLLTQLDRALCDEKNHIIGILGQAGQGKSHMLYHWLQRLAPRYGRVKRVFAWSFYHHGEGGINESEVFFQTAVKLWAEDKTQKSNSITHYASQIASQLRQHACLLILDDLQVLQHPYTGELQDIGLSLLFDEIYHHGVHPDSLVIFTAHSCPLRLLTNLPTYQSIQLPALNAGDATKLMLTKQLQGYPWEIQRLVRTVKGHSLSLRWLMYVIQHHLHASITDFLHTSPELSNAAQIITYLIENVWNENSAPLDILRTLSLFNRPVTHTDLYWLQTAKAAPLGHLSSINIQQTLEILYQQGFVLYSQNNKGVFAWDIPALLRHSLCQYYLHTPLWQTQQQQLYHHFKEKNKPQFALSHAYLAGDYQLIIDYLYTLAIPTLANHSPSWWLHILALIYPHGWQQEACCPITEQQHQHFLEAYIHCLYQVGKLEELINVYQQRINYLSSQCAWQEVISINIKISHYNAQLGHLDQAQSNINDALSICQRYNIDNLSVLNTYSIFYTYLKQGSIDNEINNYQHFLNTINHCPKKDNELLLIFLPLLIEKKWQENESLNLLSDVQVLQHQPVKKDNHYQQIKITYYLAKIYASTQRQVDAKSYLNTAIEQAIKRNEPYILPELLLLRAYWHLICCDYNSAEYDHKAAFIQIKRYKLKLLHIGALILQAHIILNKQYLPLPKKKGLSLHTSRHLNSDNVLQHATKQLHEAIDIKNEIQCKNYTGACDMLAARIAYYQQNYTQAHHYLLCARQWIEARNDTWLQQLWKTIYVACETNSK